MKLAPLSAQSEFKGAKKEEDYLNITSKDVLFTDICWMLI